VLLAQARLHARSLDDSQRAELARLDEQLDDVRSRWQVAWEKKATAEFHARLNLWRDYLEEYRNNPSANLDRYDYEVQRRVMLQLLRPDASGVPLSEDSLLNGLDTMLRAVFVPGDFIWDKEMTAGFPRDAYWYLHGRPKEEE
jgi:hypothetical protein